MKDPGLVVYTYSPLTMATHMLYGYGGGLNMEAQYEQESNSKLEYGLVKFENVQTLRINDIAVGVWRVLPKDQFEAFEKHLTGSAFKLDAEDTLEPELKVNWGNYSLNLENGFPVFYFRVAMPQHAYLEVTSDNSTTPAKVNIHKKEGIYGKSV